MSKEHGPIDCERLDELLRIAPFHQWLGLTVKSYSSEQIELEMPWREEIISNPMIGSAHGGVLASLIDLTGLYTLLSQGVTAKVTADLRVDYHRPATSGPLIVTGQVVKVGRQISVAESRIVGPDGKLIAGGRGAYIC